MFKIEVFEISLLQGNWAKYQSTVLLLLDIQLSNM